MGKLFKKRSEEILKKFKDTNVLGASSGPNFFGQQSKKRTQVRGNGVLVLTDEVLFFEMWRPKKQLEIPLKSLIAIETPKKFLGKTKFKPLLKVVFTNEQGEEDAAAWLINNLNDWKTSLEKIILRLKTNN